MVSSIKTIEFQRINLEVLNCDTDAAFDLAQCLVLRSKHFQKRRVSSAPAVATVWPSGLLATCKILCSWPGISANWLRGFGVFACHFHRRSELDGFPWQESSSLCSADHTNPLTWESVTTWACDCPLKAFQMWMVLSAEPPPLARILGCHGHHDSA